MKQSLLNRVRLLIVCVCSLFVMILFTACVSVAGTNTSTGTTGTGAITGTVKSVNPSARSVTIDVNGQQITVSGLSSTQVQQLQSQIGHMYTIQVTQSNGSYQITAGTSPQEQTSGTAQVNVTPTSNQTPAAGVNVPGTISFIGTVQSVGTSSISVKMPNGETLPVTITISTDRKDFPTVLPGNGQWVKVDAFTNPDGSFAAKSLDMVKAKDLADPTKVNKVDFKGVTTSAVASNNVLNFGVGNKHYSFTINPATTQIKNFVSAQAIQSGQPIEVTVLFTNGSPNVLEVKNGLD